MVNTLTTTNSYVLSYCGEPQGTSVFHTSSNQVYFKLSTIEGSDVTADLYIYGYILN